MVSAELGVGTLEGWISIGLWLLDTVRRINVSGTRSNEFAEFEAERYLRRRDRTHFGVPSWTARSQS